MDFCDLECIYAKWPDKLYDGSGTCMTFIALYCKKKKKIVYKNAICNEKKLNGETYEN
jgi:hypothetical protein